MSRQYNLMIVDCENWRGFEVVDIEPQPEGNPRATIWTPGAWGPIGSSGILFDGITPRAPKNKKERQAIATLRASLERSMRSQAALVDSMRIARGQA